MKSLHSIQSKNNMLAVKNDTNLHLYSNPKLTWKEKQILISATINCFRKYKKSDEAGVIIKTKAYPGRFQEV